MQRYVLVLLFFANESNCSHSVNIDIARERNKTNHVPSSLNPSRSFSKSVLIPTFSTRSLSNSSTGWSSEPLYVLEGHTGSVRGVSFSPDAKLFASGSYDEDIRIWNIEKGGINTRTLKGHDGIVRSVDFSPDGTKLASGSYDWTVRIWSIKGAAALIRTFRGHSGIVFSVKFSEDGMYVASGSSDTTVKVWSMENGNLQKTLLGHNDTINSISFGPHGKSLVSGSSDRSIKIWSMVDSTEVKTLCKHTDTVRAVDYSHDGTKIASGSSDKMVHIWNAEDGTILTTLQGDGSSVWSVKFLPDIRYVISGSDSGNVMIWNIEEGNLIEKLQRNTKRVWSVDYSPSFEMIAAGSSDRTISIWALSSWSFKPSATSLPSSIPSTFLSSEPSSSSPPSFIPTISSEPVFHPSSEPSSPKEKWWVSEPLYTFQTPASIMDIDYSPDGLRIAAGSLDGDVQIWNLEKDGAEVLTLTEHTEVVHAVHFSPDGSKLVSGSYDDTVRIWNITDGGTLIHTLLRPARVTSAKFSPDGMMVAAALFDKTVVIWYYRENIIEYLIGHTDIVRCLCFSPDGKSLASGSDDNSVKIWKIGKQKAEEETLTGHTDWLRHVEYSSDSKKLISLTDNEIIVWNVEDGRQMKIIRTDVSMIFSLTLYNDGKHFVIGGNDFAVRIYNIENSANRAQIVGRHSEYVYCVGISPNEQFIASGSGDKTIKIWALACPPGSFGKQPICELCEPGTYQDQADMDSCFPCPAGTYQDVPGAVECKKCEIGTFQASKSQTRCLVCKTGGYCSSDASADSCDGGFTPCSVGTFNSKIGKYDANACVQCPAGTFSNSEFSNELCYPCPYRLGSEKGSSSCSFCAEGFYLNNIKVSVDELKRNPGSYCLQCPINAECKSNTSIETLRGKIGYWRDSLETEKFYKCNNNTEVCKGTFCATGHGGPLCEVCDDDNKYFDHARGECTRCPPNSRYGIAVGVLAASILFIWILQSIPNKCPETQIFLTKMMMMIGSTGFQTKLKILISFYQVADTLQPVYGVRMHSSFTKWFGLISIVNFGFIDTYIMPRSCIGSLKSQLLVSGTWPYVLVILLCGGICIYTSFIESSLKRKDMIPKIISRSLNTIIVVFYFVLPSVCTEIFDAIKCVSFVTNDEKKVYSSYLIADGSIKCDSGDSEYQGVLMTFWALFFFWPVAVPFMFLCLLLYIRKTVQSNISTPFTDSCRFLWSDYRPSLMFWEFIDLVRKICLTGLIILVDNEEGSERLLRLVIASLLCLVYGIVVSRAQPYKNSHDLNLAIISNLLLTCCFVLGSVIHQCKEEQYLDGGKETCQMLFGFTDSYRATLITVLLMGSIFIAFILFIAVLAWIEVSAPTVRVVSTNSAPVMNMPEECKYHLFVSHVWKTGQDKTHNFVRLLKLYLQGVNVWLDVEVLEKVTTLEDSVAEVAFFVLFYTQGYFRSYNCRREVLAAVEQGKPTVVLYVGDDKTIDVMKEECKIMFSQNGHDPARILGHILAEEPVLWLGGGSLPFATASVKAVTLHLLRCLPYYKHKPFELEKGLTIGNEIDVSKFSYPKSIFVSSYNEGIASLVGDLKNVVGDRLVFVDSVANETKAPIMLLYLNKESFNDSDKILESAVKTSLTDGTKIVLIHEQSVESGHCAFEQLILEIIPKELQALGLLDEIAIPLFAQPQYRNVSLRLVLKKINDVFSPEDKTDEQAIEPTKEISMVEEEKEP